MIWVLLDISYLAHRSLHAVGDLEHEDVPTGVIFGFFEQLRHICMHPRIRSNKVAIFCDSPNSFRRDQYPWYKHKRTDRTEDELERLRLMRKQTVMLQSEILPSIGFPVIRQAGVESDDLIADAAFRFGITATTDGPIDRRHAVMITADGDLYQCISPWVHWFDPQRELYLDSSSFQQRKGVTPQQWADVKALAGCSSDCVPGVPGVGEKTAIRYLTGGLPPKYKAHQSITSQNGKSIVERNRWLVKLPHEKTVAVTLDEPVYNIDEFFHHCKRFGLKSILRSSKEWMSFFQGTFFHMRMRRGTTNAR